MSTKLVASKKQIDRAPMRTQGPIRQIVPIMEGDNPAVAAKVIQGLTAANQVMKTVKPATYANKKLQRASEQTKKGKLWKAANAVTGWTSNHLGWGKGLQIIVVKKQTKRKTTGSGKRKTKKK